MEEQPVIHSTFVIERNYPKPPEHVFSAFADAAKKRRWFAEGEKHELEEFEMDFRAGGMERARYRFKEGTPFPGVRDRRSMWERRLDRFAGRARRKVNRRCMDA